ELSLAHGSGMGESRAGNGPTASRLGNLPGLELLLLQGMEKASAHAHGLIPARRECLWCSGPRGLGEREHLRRDPRPGKGLRLTPGRKLLRARRALDPHCHEKRHSSRQVSPPNGISAGGGYQKTRAVRSISLTSQKKCPEHRLSFVVPLNRNKPHQLRSKI